MYRLISARASALGLLIASIALAASAAATPVFAGASILVDIDSGKVLRADNATYPWYPASTTKLMTLYMTLSAIRDHRITQDTLFTVSPNASAQAPTKMGFPVGTQVTVDNALKMMMVKSANDMAVLLAEGVSGSIDNFAQEMTDTAHRIGMTESNFVNPNGLPADGQITSARDLAILARALYREFPQYDFYWHVPAIKWGKRIVRNYNTLLGRYPGTDGMKTGFICASGFNMVASAKRDGRRLVAVVLGAPSGAVRAVRAAELLESGFTQNPLSWLTPSLGTVESLAPMDVSPPNLKDEMCGPHRKRPASEEEADAGGTDSGDSNASPQFSVLLSALRAPTPKNANLLTDDMPMTPVVVYTGPTRTPAEIAKLSTEVAADPAKKKSKAKTAAAHPPDSKSAASTATGAKSKDSKAANAKNTDNKSTEAKAADAKDAKTSEAKASAPKTSEAKASDGKAKSGAAWTPTSGSRLASSPPPELKTGGTASTATQKKPAKPHPPAAPAPTAQ